MSKSNADPELQQVFKGLHKVKALTEEVETLKSLLEVDKFFFFVNHPQSQDKELAVYRLKSLPSEVEEKLTEIQITFEPKCDICIHFFPSFLIRQRARHYLRHLHLPQSRNRNSFGSRII
jgi:hypothetical protein